MLSESALELELELSAGALPVLMLSPASEFDDASTVGLRTDAALEEGAELDDDDDELELKLELKVGVLDNGVEAEEAGEDSGKDGEGV